MLAEEELRAHPLLDPRVQIDHELLSSMDVLDWVVRRDCSIALSCAK